MDGHQTPWSHGGRSGGNVVKVVVMVMVGGELW